MKKEMETQKIIITGGATRIGAAIAEDLANIKNQKFFKKWNDINRRRIS